MTKTNPKNNRGKPPKNPKQNPKPNSKEQQHPSEIDDQVKDQTTTTVTKSPMAKTTNPSVQVDSKNSSEPKNSNSKFNLAIFLKDVNTELSKVAWPSRQQLISESLAVLLMVIVAAVLVYLVDSLFGWAASQIF